jgi:hypothetical protein
MYNKMIVEGQLKRAIQPLSVEYGFDPNRICDNVKTPQPSTVGFMK